MIGEMVIGADFGSDSVRVVVVDAQNGKLQSEAVQYYPRWKEKKYCDFDNSCFRQHPLDYIEAFEACVREAVKNSGRGADKLIRALAIDTTGSTPCPVDKNGTPLALLEEFSENPNAMFHLWKDHTAIEEAKEINDLFSSDSVDYTQYQGTYSSEWYWAKILHTIRTDDSIKQAAWHWVEHCDWMPAMLIGDTSPETVYRGSCAAGHKALWHSSFNGLPSKTVLNKLDPYLSLLNSRYRSIPKPAGANLGTLSKQWAKRLGLPENTIVGGGSFDAHAGAVGAGIQPRTMVKVVGTSTVDMLIENAENLRGKNLKQYCGQAEDSIVPGYVGIEAGQAAFGDVYTWFAELLMWPVRMLMDDSETASKIDKVLISELARRAEEIDGHVLAIDWLNGRRYPILNENVKGALFGLTLGTSAPEIFKALAVSTVLGSKRIFNSFIDNGMIIDRLICVGGIAKKSPYIVQMLSDALERPIMVSNEEQSCARGAAIYAAVAAGFFPDILSAQNIFCEPYKADYFPNQTRSLRLRKLYEQYLHCGEFVESIIEDSSAESN